ncbi:hypothetical protein GGR57DRAFT_437055 [Xylariaceae sp. FL1272]|nr:hypothetical protein GGR57DRAFT_437055 [Xylariaceae sp. FL1272]
MENQNLGESKANPLFVVVGHSGMTSKPELELFDGPDDSTAQLLATATHDSWRKPKQSILTIPKQDGVSHEDGNERIIMASSSIMSKHVTYSFEAPVGIGKDSRIEQFEWRTSHGSEVKAVDGYSWGWKLVRLSQTVGDPGEGSTRSVGSTSDGKEVVAAWAFNNTWSMSKTFKFQFQGSALTGVMGDRWAALALVSALRIFNIEYAIISTSAAT